MAITFYNGSGSPFAWYVWFVLEHKQLDYTVKTLSFSNKETRTTEFMKLNPHHRIPVIDDNGFVLYESTPIVEYLEDQYPDHGQGRLFPVDPKQKALVRRFIAEVYTYFQYYSRKMSLPISFTPRDQWNWDEINKAKESALKELALLTQQHKAPFIFGKLSAADYALYPILALIKRLCIQSEKIDYQEFITPQWTEWMNNIEQLPVYKPTIPPHWRE